MAVTTGRSETVAPATVRGSSTPRSVSGTGALPGHASGTGPVFVPAARAHSGGRPTLPEARPAPRAEAGLAIRTEARPAPRAEAGLAIRTEARPAPRAEAGLAIR
ncbi:hypothetical protein ACIHCM_05155, partial [Streptomyces sp. NPDC052023]